MDKQKKSKLTKEELEERVQTKAHKKRLRDLKEKELSLEYDDIFDQEKFLSFIEEDDS